MTRIPEDERDRNIFEKGNFKLNQPYLNMIEETIKDVQREMNLGQ